jgi:signal transduction histidine kinase
VHETRTAEENSCRITFRHPGSSGIRGTDAQDAPRVPLPQQTASFDESQLEQVLIKLLKNAAESGSPPADITVSVRKPRRGR